MSRVCSLPLPPVIVTVRPTTPEGKVAVLSVSEHRSADETEPASVPAFLSIPSRFPTDAVIVLADSVPKKTVRVDPIKPNAEAVIGRGYSSNHQRFVR